MHNVVGCALSVPLAKPLMQSWKYSIKNKTPQPGLTSTFLSRHRLLDLDSICSSFFSALFYRFTYTIQKYTSSSTARLRKHGGKKCSVAHDSTCQMRFRLHATAQLRKQQRWAFVSSTNESKYWKYNIISIRNHVFFVHPTNPVVTSSSMQLLFKVPPSPLNPPPPFQMGTFCHVCSHSSIVAEKAFPIKCCSLSHYDLCLRDNLFTSFSKQNGNNHYESPPTLLHLVSKNDIT